MIIIFLTYILLKKYENKKLFIASGEMNRQLASQGIVRQLANQEVIRLASEQIVSKLA